MARDEIKTENMGKVTIGKTSSTGSLLFGTPLEHRKLVSIDFKTAHLSTSFRDSSLFGDRNISRIHLSSDQWSSLLLNSNNENGVPCTILMREDCPEMEYGYKKSTNRKDSDEIDSLVDNFKKELSIMFPTFKSIKQKSVEILHRNKQTANDRKELKDLIEKMKEEFSNNKEELETLINNFLNSTNTKIDENLKREVKENFLGFSSLDNKELAHKILGISETKLIENKTVESVDLNKHHGVLTLKNIQSETGFVEDFDSVNGFEISLHQAIEELVNGQKVITKGEVILTIRMSVSQFSNFLTAFGEGDGVASTIIYRKTTGKIEQTNYSVDILDRRLKEFQEDIESIDGKIEEVSNKLEETLKRKVGVKKVREVEIDFEQFYNYVISNVSFNLEELVREKMKSSVNRRMDIQFNIERVIKDLGVKTFNNQIKDQDFSSLIEMTTNNGQKLLS